VLFINIFLLFLVNQRKITYFQVLKSTPNKLSITTFCGDRIKWVKTRGKERKNDPSNIKEREPLS